MIPNPTRKVTLNKPVAYIMNRLKWLGGWSGNDTGITITNATIDYNLNSYSFKSKANIFGIIDMGNYGNVTVNPVGDSSCELTIEMGKNYGCISDQYEAQDCNSQITSFLNILSRLIGMPDEEISKLPTQNTQVDASPITAPSWKSIGVIWAIAGVLGLLTLILNAMV